MRALISLRRREPDITREETVRDQPYGSLTTKEYNFISRGLCLTGMTHGISKSTPSSSKSNLNIKNTYKYGRDSRWIVENLYLFTILIPYDPESNVMNTK